MQRPRRSFGLTTRPLIYGGNRIRLLKNGGEYFPRLFSAIDAARRSVHLETYIFELDEVGARLADALIVAAQRGVEVRVLIDGFGSARTAERLTAKLRPQGVQLLVFRPGHWWRLDRRLLRRMHRKIATIDGALAFVGGINVIDDHNHLDVRDAGLGPRYDFAVECSGPIVGPIEFAVQRLWRTVAFLQRPLLFARRPRLQALPAPAPQPDGMRAALVLRDNLGHRRAIERAYVEAFGTARSDVIIAMAYFLPGRRLRQALIELAARGVRVRLLLQGRVEYWLQHYAQVSLYGELLAAGIHIHEYTASFLHAKVAVIDERWATVGSSNIDPYSLLFAREANIAVYDARFARELREELEAAMATAAVQIDAAVYADRDWWRRAAHRLAYMLVRFATVVAARGSDD